MGEAISATSKSLSERWRAYVAGLATTDRARMEELGGRLSADSAALESAGLEADEALLVALRRAAGTDPVPRAFLRADVEALVPVPVGAVPEATVTDGTAASFKVMLGCAIAAAVAVRVPALLGHSFSDDLYLLNLSLFALPFLLVLFAWTHRPPRKHLIVAASLLAAGALFANAYPFVSGGSTQLLTAIHLPIALWLILGVAATGGGWLSLSRRMEYTRFTGEWIVTYTLIALGGGVLSAMTVGLFEAIGVSTELFVAEWLIPCGAMGAVLVAAWLVETRRRFIEGVAPMLARVFTPLFTVMLVALLVGVVWSKGFIDVDRDLLIVIDLLLVVVVAMLLYGISARGRDVTPRLFDRIQLVLVACAMAVDVFALANMAVRMGQYGFSANRTAALGLNLILLVNLIRSAYLQAGFLRSKRTFAEVEDWQMRYLPVYAAWAGVVVVLFPLLFSFA